jgi:hypothetical protein
MTARTNITLFKQQRTDKIVAWWQQKWYFIIGISLIVCGAYFGHIIALKLNIAPYELKDGISIFAVFYILAQALERLLEPFSGFLPGKGETGAQTDPTQNGQQTNKIIQQQRATIMWGLASCLAMLGSGLLGMFFLQAIGVKGAPLWLDIAVSGLVVGAGTKPLHDLIKKIEKSKE